MYGSENKTKLVAVRMTPELHKKLGKMADSYNAGRWYRKTSISNILCLAAEDFTEGNQKNIKEFNQEIARKKNER